MTSKKFGLMTVSVLAVALAAYVVRVNAQQPAAKPQAQPTTQPAVQEVTLKGRVVDLHGFMTGQFASADHVKCTADCIRQGVPAGLETAQGLVVLGQGANGPGRTLIPLAFQNAEVTGKLYTKGGVRYIDITSAKIAE